MEHQLYFDFYCRLWVRADTSVVAFDLMQLLRTVDCKENVICHEWFPRFHKVQVL